MLARGTRLTIRARVAGIARAVGEGGTACWSVGLHRTRRALRAPRLVVVFAGFALDTIGGTGRARRASIRANGTQITGLVAVFRLVLAGRARNALVPRGRGGVAGVAQAVGDIVVVGGIMRAGERGTVGVATST